jgi:hypothetical protein
VRKIRSSGRGITLGDAVAVVGAGGRMHSGTVVARAADDAKHAARLLRALLAAIWKKKAARE